MKKLIPGEKKRKIDGIDVSVPCDVTNDEIKKDIGQTIQDGIYNAVEVIVPQKFRKLVFDGTTPDIKEYEVVRNMFDALNHCAII